MRVPITEDAEKDSAVFEAKPVYKKFRKCFTELVRPESESPSMPKKVSSLSPDKISDLMFRISAWRDYTDDLIYLATVECLEAKERYQNATDVGMLTAKGSSVKEKEARIRSNPQIQELRQDYLHKEMYLEMLERKFDNYTNNISVISREITRRSNL